MATNCAPLTGAINLDPSCAALKKKGGISKRIYIGSVADVSAYTVDATTKELKTLVMKAGKTLLSASGKKYKNNTTHGNEQTENGPLFPHNVVFAAYYNSQLEKETLESLAAADDLFIVVELNSGKLEVYGLVAQNGQLGEGLTMTSTGGSGTNAEDAANLILTFAGREDKMPVFASFGATLSDDIAYMDARLSITAPPTAGVVDDTANTFNWTNNPTYTALGDYEYTLDGGSTYATVTAKPIVVGAVSKAIGQVGVRVKAATGRNASDTLFNTVPFTV